MLKKLLAVLLVVSMLMTGLAFAQEAETVVEHQPVVVLYTNDVHCGIEDAIGYAGLAAYEKAYEKLGYEVILVDNGDAIQGGPIGTLSKGEYIIDIMNAVGYDIATIGNHEFDYGMDVFMSLREKAEFHSREIIDSTLEAADQLIDKQMRVVQNIASILGESTAETKVMLTKLKEAVQSDA